MCVLDCACFVWPPPPRQRVNQRPAVCLWRRPTQRAGPSIHPSFLAYLLTRPWPPTMPLTARGSSLLAPGRLSTRTGHPGTARHCRVGQRLRPVHEDTRLLHATVRDRARGAAHRRIQQRRVALPSLRHQLEAQRSHVARVEHLASGQRRMSYIRGRHTQEESVGYRKSSRKPGEVRPRRTS